jgi:hypothetical protein
MLAYAGFYGFYGLSISFAHLNRQVGLGEKRTHLGNGAAADLFHFTDELVKLAVGKNTLLPARIHLEQPLQVAHLRLVYCTTPCHARTQTNCMS